MKKYIKILSIIIGVICLCSLILWIGCHILIRLSHQSIIEKSHDYEPHSILSENEKFLLKTKKIDEATGTYATFVIENLDEKKLIFECPDKYRTIDLKSINWKGFDVVVVSGDVGTITYSYDNDWAKEGNNDIS